jgi:glyoxylase-like metal-dependent hydrolase (beta-lactamase superfamily II)
MPARNVPMTPQVEAFYDTATGTVSYVVFDEPGGHAAIVDPVLDYDHRSGRTRAVNADRIVAFAQAQSLHVDWILETHAHADHLSAARYLKRRLGGTIAIGERIRHVQGVFKDIFNLGDDFPQDGSQFDHLFPDDAHFRIGKLSGEVMYVPGHTPADVAYRVGDTVFIGDTMFMPDVGTARCDFPGGDAHALYRSIRRLLDLPRDTRLFVCHDYPPPGRAPRWESTVAEQRAANIHVHDGIDERAFVAMRTARDATLDMPLLILPAIQVNIRAGDMPAAESNGVSYLKIPIDSL